MAFLLLLHQKMKLQRKENQLTLKQLRFSSQVDRMQKKVDKRQKYYDKLKKQLERQANCYKNQMNSYFTQMAGLGMNSVNLMNPYGSNGATQMVLHGWSKDQMNQMLGLDGTANGGYQIDSKVAEAIQNGTLQYAQKAFKFKGKTGEIDIPEGSLYNGYTGEIIGGTDAQAAGQAYQQLQQMAQMQVAQRQQQVQMLKSNYEENVSIWLEASMENLEAQEEYEMDLLAEEQSDMEAEKNSIEVQLQRVQEEKKNVEQALGNAIQDSAPKFGLA